MATAVAWPHICAVPCCLALELHHTSKFGSKTSVRIPSYTDTVKRSTGGRQRHPATAQQSNAAPQPLQFSTHNHVHRPQQRNGTVLSSSNAPQQHKKLPTSMTTPGQVDTHYVQGQKQANHHACALSCRRVAAQVHHSIIKPKLASVAAAA